MERYAVAEIGSSAFFVFADGMIKVEEVVFIWFDNDKHVSVRTKDRMTQTFMVIEDVPQG